MPEIEITAGVAKFDDGTRYEVVRKDPADPASTPISVHRVSADGRRQRVTQVADWALAQPAIDADHERRGEERVQFRIGEVDGSWIVQERRENNRARMTNDVDDSSPWVPIGSPLPSRALARQSLPVGSELEYENYGAPPGYEVWSYSGGVAGPGAPR